MYRMFSTLGTCSDLPDNLGLFFTSRIKETASEAHGAGGGAGVNSGGRRFPAPTPRRLVGLGDLLPAVAFHSDLECSDHQIDPI